MRVVSHSNYCHENCKMKPFFKKHALLPLSKTHIIALHPSLIIHHSVKCNHSNLKQDSSFDHHRFMIAIDNEISSHPFQPLELYGFHIIILLILKDYGQKIKKKKKRMFLKVRRRRNICKIQRFYFLSGEKENAEWLRFCWFGRRSNEKSTEFQKEPLDLSIWNVLQQIIIIFLVISFLFRSNTKMLTVIYQ